MASFAQQRLWMNEKLHFNQSINEQIPAHNEWIIYKVKSTNYLSIYRLCQAVSTIIAKHAILRTALIYDEDKLIQKVLPIPDYQFDFEITFLTGNTELEHILHDEETNRSLFDLEQGRVFRCRIFRHVLNDNDDNNLKQDDIILFNFHHMAIDDSSIKIFMSDLRQALTKQELSVNDQDGITYIDYAQYERLEDWSCAQKYWSHVLATLDNSIDQQNFMMRKGKDHIVNFDLDHDLVIKLNHFISQSNLTLFQVGLAAFFVFLFKMSNNQQLDFCTGIVIANRPQYQLQNILGSFANILPCYMRIDPCQSFTKFCHRIHQFYLDILPHSHLPYQEIVKLCPNLGPSILWSLFLVETAIDSSLQHIEIDERTTLNMIGRNVLSTHIANFGLICAFHEHRQNETISITFNVSLDLFDRITIEKMAQRFHFMLQQLFNVINIEQSKPIYELSLNLPDEQLLMKSMNNTDIIFSSSTCIHHEFVKQVMEHSQKLAVELDDQCLTYSELLYYVQVLSLNLLSEQGVNVGDIVCQCVERSLSM
ncbi:unnamed protein product, partial [Rotaria sp. Silwood2]